MKWIALISFAASLATAWSFSACTPGQNQPTRPGEQPAPVTPEAPAPGVAEEPVVATMEVQAETIEKLWAVGSRYSNNVEVLESWRAPGQPEVFGEVQEIRVANAPQFFDHQLRQFLIKIERVTGEPYGGKYIPPANRPNARVPRGVVGGTEWRTQEPKAVGTVVDGPIGPGDLVWVTTRIRTGSQIRPEEVIAKGDRLWAVYERFPEEALDPFLSPKITPLAWTAGLSAYSMRGRMGN